jgi:hypothetical protein
MSFAVKLNQFSAATTDKVERLRRGVALKLFTAVILDTPVDTGRLRGAWLCTVNKASGEEPTTTDPTGSKAIQGVMNTVSEGGSSDTFILTNNLPYAARIEYEGHSSVKAPNGMVRRNVARFKELVSQEIAKLKLAHLGS